MRRKIVQQGATTLMVSLPAAWARANNIKKGIEVELEEKEDKLIISSTAEPPAKEIDIDLTGMWPFMLRMLAAIYKSGYDEVKITFDDPKTINQIQDSIGKEISGFEIIEQTKSYCVLQDIEGVIKERFDSALKRIFYLLLQMAEESVSIIEDKRYAELKPLRFLEEGNNRFTTFCRRSLSKRGYKEKEKIQFIYLVVEQLERIADQYKYLFDFLMLPENRQLSIKPAVLKEYSKLNAMLRMYYEFFYKYEKNKLIGMANSRKTIIDNCMELFKKASNKECMFLHYIITISQTIFETIEPTVSLNF